MLQPKRTKFRKAFKGRIHGASKAGIRTELRAIRPEGARTRGGSPRARSRPLVEP